MLFRLFLERMLNGLMKRRKMTVDKQGDLVLGNGSFFCEACLVDKLVEQRSPDSRYCQDCYDFLTGEAKLLSGTRRPKWVPKPKK